MNPRTGRLAALIFGVLSGTGAYVAYPSLALAASSGFFWAAAGLLARRNWWAVRRRGSLRSGVYSGLSALAATAVFTSVASLSFPDGLGFALGLFVLGVANAMTGVGVELASAHAGDEAGDAAPGASAAPDGEDATRGR